MVAFTVCYADLFLSILILAAVFTCECKDHTHTTLDETIHRLTVFTNEYGMPHQELWIAQLLAFIGIYGLPSLISDLVFSNLLCMRSWIQVIGVSEVL